MNHFLAWLYWDPKRVAFTIPWVEHPIVWYGLCFVFGFIVGYLIILPMVQKKLVESRKLSERDIANWPQLIKILLQGPAKPGSLLFRIVQKFDKKTWDLLRKHQEQLPEKSLRSSILSAFNAALKDPALQINRNILETLFPKSIHTLRDISLYLVDRLTWFVVAGTILGARLGHVFFYDWARYQDNPADIFKVWEGGLASHGGVIGIILALFFYQRAIRERFPEFSFITILDLIVIPTAFAACCIRFGNFINQEILGTPTTLPWAVIFGHPADGSLPEPRHPVQLYEAGVYLFTFFLLYYLWKFKSVRPGFLSGLFFIFVFGSRFLFEFLKAPQGAVIDESYIQMGQLLSLPCIALGLFLIKGKKDKGQIRLVVND